MPTPARIRATIATIAAPPEELREIREYHKVLADTTRLRLVQRLAQASGSVTELTEYVDLSQPLVSWHLRRLATAGLIEMRRSGREVICSLLRDALERYHEREQALLGLGRR